VSEANIVASQLRGSRHGWCFWRPWATRRRRCGLHRALGCRFPPWQANTITVIFYQHNDSVGTSNWALQILDKLCRYSSLALFLLVLVHFVHSLPFTRCFWVRTASLVNYPASFEGLVLIEVCGMDIHIPPLGFFAF